MLLPGSGIASRKGQGGWAGFVRMVLAVAVLGGLVMSGSAADEVLLEDFENPAGMSRWEFMNGPEFPGADGRFERSRDVSSSGNYSGAIHFDFNGGGNYVMASVNLPQDNNATHIRLRIYKTTGNKLTIRCTDSDGQTFQKSFSVPFQGWQEVQVSFTGFVFGWGGKQDGVVRLPMHIFGLIVENDAERTGTVYIDDVRLVNIPDAEREEVETSYTVTRFENRDRWYIISAGPAGVSSFGDGLLKYDFSAGASAVGAHTDFAIMGKPSRMALRLQSDGSGREVFVQLGSHFQIFEKVFGKLTEKGEMTFEANLVGMEGWGFHGGENNGLPMYPLRLWNVLLRGEGNTEKGEVRLLEITADTLIPRSQEVVVIPHGYAADKTAKFQFDFHNITTQPVSGRAIWTVNDWSRRVIASGFSEISIPANSMRRVEVYKGFQEHPMLECHFRIELEDGRKFGPQTASAALGFKDPENVALDPESPFGMGVYLYRYPNNPEGLARMDKAAALARNAGVKWTREEFQWHRIEPEEGKYDWSYYDAMVETAHRHGISVYGLIAYWSNWTEPYTLKGVQDYANFCRALVGRYKDRIKHWEVWNEPNIFFWSGPKELYNDLLKEAYKAIKETDPEALVLGCSTAGIDRTFIEQVMDSGAPFDILTIHPYRGQLNAEGFMQELQQIHELTGRDDSKPKPVWITEMGWPTHLYGGVSERYQASLLSRCYLSAVASGVPTNVSWYNFREDGANPFYNEHRFGVIRSDTLAPKPGYRALGTVCKTLDGKYEPSRLNLQDGLLAFEFKGRGGRATAVWSPDSDMLVAFRFAGDDVRFIDLMGGEAAHIRVGDTVILPLERDIPLFMEGPDSLPSAAPSPLEVILPRTVHPGQRLEVAPRVSGVLSGATVKLEGPDGWEIVQDEAGVYNANIPGDAMPGPVSMILRVTLGEEVLDWPVTLEVVPAVLKV